MVASHPSSPISTEKVHMTRYHSLPIQPLSALPASAASPGVAWGNFHHLLHVLPQLVASGQCWLADLAASALHCASLAGPSPPGVV